MILLFLCQSLLPERVWRSLLDSNKMCTNCWISKTSLCKYWYVRFLLPFFQKWQHITKVQPPKIILTYSLKFLFCSAFYIPFIISCSPFFFFFEPLLILALSFMFLEWICYIRSDQFCLNCSAIPYLAAFQKCFRELHFKFMQVCTNIATLEFFPDALELVVSFFLLHVM